MNGKKTKIFICITKSNWGGAQKYVFDIAKSLPKYEFDVSVLLGGDGELKSKLDAAGIKTIMLRNSQRDIDVKKEFGLLSELIKIFKKEKPDVVHLNSSKMGFVGALAGRMAGIKRIIFTGHGWAFNEDRNFISKIFFRILHICTILLSHKSIAVSEITKRQIWWPFNKKMIVVRNGVREIDFKDKISAQESLSIKVLKKNPDYEAIFNKNPLWIGTISELHKNKGLKYAIEAISKLKEHVIFMIIGEGEERKNLEDLIKKLKVSEKVFLLGRIENASSYLKAFGILTMTSITEALPYFLLEAGAGGLPVIASKVGGIPEIIDHEKTGILVPRKNSEKIKDTLEDLIKNTGRRKMLGDNLKEKIDREFTLQNMIDQTIKIYQV